MGILTPPFSPLVRKAERSWSLQNENGSLRRLSDPLDESEGHFLEKERRNDEE
jgi:hypothetical protein